MSCHDKTDIKTYRYLCGSLVSNVLCSATELARALGVRARNIQRYAQRYATEGGESFFAPHSRKGTAFRFTAELQEQANELLAQGASNYRVAKEGGVSEGTVRYHLKKGTLIRPDFKN